MNQSEGRTIIIIIVIAAASSVDFKHGGALKVNYGPRLVLLQNGPPLLLLPHNLQWIVIFISMFHRRRKGAAEIPTKHPHNS